MTPYPLYCNQILGSPLLQIDCVTPFQGTADALAEKVCGHLKTIDPKVEVKLQEIKNASTEIAKTGYQVDFMVLQISKKINMVLGLYAQPMPYGAKRRVFRKAYTLPQT